MRELPVCWQPVHRHSLHIGNQSPLLTVTITHNIPNINIPFCVFIMPMTNREIIVIDSSDEELEFEWEPENEDNFDEVDVPDAFASYHCPI